MQKKSGMIKLATLTYHLGQIGAAVLPTWPKNLEHQQILGPFLRRVNIKRRYPFYLKIRGSSKMNTGFALNNYRLFLPIDKKKIPGIVHMIISSLEAPVGPKKITSQPLQGLWKQSVTTADIVRTRKKNIVGWEAKALEQYLKYR